MDIQKQVVIAIVAGPNDKEYVEKNIKLIDMLNPSTTYSILIIDNQNSTGIKQNNWDLQSNAKCQVIDGVSQDFNLPYNCRGSYQHGQALTSVLNQDRYKLGTLIIMDPDFYIIKNEWIKGIISKISNKKIFIGAPWHPKWWPKYRRFPCVHFMAIDLNSLGNQILDFEPDVEVRAMKKLAKTAKIKSKGEKLTKRKINSNSFLRKNLLTVFIQSLMNKAKILNRIAKQNTKGRLLIGSSHDTGHQIYKKFKNIGKDKIYLLRPFVEFRKTYGSIVHLNFKFGRLFEKSFFNKYSYIDSKSKISLKNFKDFELPDLNNYGWEEFFDEMEPYAFHMRRFNKKDRNQNQELKLLDLVIKQIKSN